MVTINLNLSHEEFVLFNDFAKIEFIRGDILKYLRRELNQVEKEYLKQFGEDSLNRVILHDPNTKDKQEIQDTIDILKEAIAKNKPLEQVPEDMWKLIEF